MHYGTKGQKWGVRHYQNKDSTRTAAGKERYKKPGHHSNEFMSKPTTEWSNLDRQNYFYWRDGLRTNNRWRWIKSDFSQEIEYREMFNKLSENAGCGKIFTEGKNVFGSKDTRANAVKAFNRTAFNKWVMSMANDLKRPLTDAEIDEWAQGFGNAAGSGYVQIAKDAVQMANRKIIAKKNATSGMPTSAISAKSREEAEAKMKKNIPASAWNQRASQLSKSNKLVQRGSLVGMPSSAKEQKKQAEIDSMIKANIPASAWAQYQRR